MCMHAGRARVIAAEGPQLKDTETDAIIRLPCTEHLWQMRQAELVAWLSLVLHILLKTTVSAIYASP